MYIHCVKDQVIHNNLQVEYVCCYCSIFTHIQLYHISKILYNCGSQGKFNEITPEFIGGWFIPISSHFTDLHRYDHRPHVRRPYVLHTLRAIARYSCYI